MSDILRDNRKLPIFIHSELDDANLTVEEFRVYAHLARRANKSGEAWPSYNSIGETCFRGTWPTASKSTLRRKAIKAVAGLMEKGLINKSSRVLEDGGFASNVYELTAKEQWDLGGGSAYTPPLVHIHHPSAYAPKGTPSEDYPSEGYPESSSSSGRTRATDPIFGHNCTVYEQNIGMLTPFITDEIRKATDHFPEGWIPDAIAIAVLRNKRSWSYVRAILEKWETNGKDDGKPADKKNGTGPKLAQHEEGPTEWIVH